ncbi:ATP F0F1 synthase subunit B [Microvirga vignae]|uniref:ATP synthase subunit b n=1 Tax=Microvirga vignae TaxID=1225564 RepID=A0A0H1R8R2_9HYPH|nr:ATP F0F1 synthase subunit B [Microvirga vignae]KLK91231.1 ATP F0F1 synthase subunit B [Microvirga vignae]
MSHLFADAEFWVALAFIIFWGIMFYLGVPGKVLNQLDSRGKRIADELAEAKRLREDAEKLLREFEAKRAAAEREAAEIVSSAKEEAERMAREAQEKMADFVKRRTASAEAKIAQAEAQASAEVRAAAVDAAIKASERVLRQEITGNTAASLVSRGLNDVRSKLQ